jgi:Mn2+/Fe2+ NRAMP family transporter
LASACSQSPCSPPLAPTPSGRPSVGPPVLTANRSTPRLYVAIAISTLIGVGINFVGLDPIKALFWSAVINGVVAVPLMVIIMLMAMREDVMGDFVLPRALWAIGWLSTATMAVVVAIMFATW